MTDCYCGSGKDFTECCGPVIDGSSPAQTAEALMRARYSAFASHQAEFLHISLHPEYRDDHDVVATRKWAENSQWLGLKIVAVEDGGLDDDSGRVEFIATYKERGLVHPYHEISTFSKVDGHWYYVDGKLVTPTTEVRDHPKIGRNDPCPCGSGKKYKKCCGR